MPASDIPHSSTNTLSACAFRLLVAAGIPETPQVHDGVTELCALVGSLDQRLTALEASHEVHTSGTPNQAPSHAATPLMDRIMALERRVLDLEGRPEPLYVPTIVRRIQDLEERMGELRRERDVPVALRNGEPPRKRTYGDDICRDDIKRPRCEKAEGGSQTSGAILTVPAQLMDELLNAMNGDTIDDSMHENRAASQWPLAGSSSEPTASNAAVVKQGVGSLETIHDTSSNVQPSAADADMGEGIRETLVNAIANMVDYSDQGAANHTKESDPRPETKGAEDVVMTNSSDGDVGADKEHAASHAKVEAGEDTKSTPAATSKRPMLPPLNIPSRLDIPCPQTPSPPSSSTFTRPQPRQPLIRAASNSVPPTPIRILSLPPDFAPHMAAASGSGADTDLFPSPPKPQRKRRAASVQVPKRNKLHAPTVSPTSLSARLARAAPSPSAEGSSSTSKTVSKAKAPAPKATKATSTANPTQAEGTTTKGKTRAPKAAAEPSTPQEPAPKTKTTTRSKGKAASNPVDTAEPVDHSAEPVDSDAEPADNAPGKAKGETEPKGKTRSNAKKATKPFDNGPEPANDGDAEPAGGAPKAAAKAKGKARPKPKTGADLAATDPTDTEPVDATESSVGSCVGSSASNTAPKAKAKARSKGEAATKAAADTVDPDETEEPVDDVDESTDNVATKTTKAPSKAKAGSKTKAPSKTKTASTTKAGSKTKGGASAK